MPLERLFLILVVIGGGIWAFAALIGAVAAGPFGLVPLAGLILAGYILWRLWSERRTNAEDDYYEDRFDK